MADPADPQPATVGLDTTFDAWRTAFARIATEVADGRTPLDQALAHATSEDAHAGAIAELAGVRAQAALATAALDGLIHRVEELHAEWRAARRFDEHVVRRRVHELRQKLTAEPRATAREWLREIFDAIDAGRWDAVELLVADELAWPPAVGSGARVIRDAAARWRRGDHAAGLELVVLLGDARLGGWDEVLGPGLRSHAYRLAAWVSLRHLRQPELAEQNLSTAIALWPYAGRMYAERAAYYLSIGDLDMAATDAQRAVELAKDDATGYLELGIWAELSGEFDDADAFYRTSLALLPAYEIARLGVRVSLMDPPGRLLTRAAEALRAAERPQDALRIAEQALHSDQRGPELHPQAAAHHARSLALEDLGTRSADAAAAAVEAGKLHAYNGDVGRAIERFERAAALDPELREVGWLLADTRLTTSLPVGATVTDQSVVAEARATWEAWAARVGQPQGETSWAYLTRAMIADLGTQRPEADRQAGMLEALMYVEKAILHDDVDAQRWGYAAQYLRFLHLDELAFEAADRGYELGSGDRQVLTERLAQLAARGRLVEADDLAEDLVAMFGNDPWVSAARAWLAIHSDHDRRFKDGLVLLELPIAGGNDPSWYYEMRALCHVATGDLDAAREDYRVMLRDALPVDGTTKSRLQVAAVVLGEADEAVRWSAEAASDPTSLAINRLSADAFAAFARGAPEAAAALLADAVEHAASVIELHDICDMTLLRLPLLPDDATGEHARERVAEVVDGPVKERERWLSRMHPSPDQELEAALAMVADQPEALPLSRVVLRAVKARRDWHLGRLPAATATYQQLRGSDFEPEATIGLARTLRALARQKADAGDVKQVRKLTQRLTRLEDVSDADVAATVASALERSGSRAAAREQLEAVIATENDDRERAKLHQRAGGLALGGDDLDGASVHFQAALDLAGGHGWHGRRGQAHVRIALVALLRGEAGTVRDHLVAALRAWKEAGAVDPPAALRGELLGLKRLRGSCWNHAAGEALELVESALSPDAAGTDLEPLRRELRLG